MDAGTHLDAAAYVDTRACFHIFPDSCTDWESRAYAVSDSDTITDAQPVSGSNHDAGDGHAYGH